MDLPEDKILIPGVIDSTTNFVEHPELVAQRILRFTDIVGSERVIAGTDCGFSTFAGFGAVDEDIVYAKLAVWPKVRHVPAINWGLSRMSLKQRLAAGEPLLGTFFKTPSPMLCEVIAQTDIDFVCLDAEHSPFDRLTLDQGVFALRAGNMPGVVRVPALSGEPILNALDCGATGVVVPHDYGG